MTTLIVAILITAIGAVVYLLAPAKFDELGRAFLWTGALAITALLCGLL